MTIRIVVVGGTPKGFRYWVFLQDGSTLDWITLTAHGPGWEAIYVGHEVEKLMGQEFDIVVRLGLVSEQIDLQIAAHSNRTNNKTLTVSAA